MTGRPPWDKQSVIKSWDDFIGRDGVASLRKANMAILTTPMNRDQRLRGRDFAALQQDLSTSSFRSELKVEDKSSRSGKLKFKSRLSETGLFIPKINSFIVSIFA